jgi:cyclophilin family peptidyl-prolyl cis-trans isomerase
MKERLLTHRVWVGLVLSLFVLVGPACALETVVIDTSQGKITLELDDQRAPDTVANFLEYVDSGFYDGTIFHRVIGNFMIQGGGFDVELQRKSTRPAIRNEAANGLRNLRGSIAMARTNVVDSATSQFFINLKDNGFLNHRNRTRQGFGYAVFGRVVEGMDVVERIGAVRTYSRNRMFADLPAETVEIRTMRRVK